MNNKFTPVLLASTVFFAGCLEQNTSATETTTTPIVKKEDAVAAVNGQYISKKSLEDLENELKQRSRGGQTFPKERLVEELVQRELLVQDALKHKLDQSPEFIEQLNNIKFALLSQAAIKQYMDSNPITDEELKAEYTAKFGGGDHGGEQTEYKARHILVKTEEEAKKLITELQKGADFVELAKTKSTGPSASNGGDLGWFTADRMVPPFSEAVIALEKGKFTTEPVQTQFGWHVILKEDSRKQVPPPFESVKEQARPMLQRQRIQAYVANLRNQAEIEILLPNKDTQAAPTSQEPEPSTTTEN